MNTKVPSRSSAKNDRCADTESLYHELLKWYFDKGELAKARAVAARLEAELQKSPEYSQSIRGEEVRSIISELHGDLPEAIQSREAEIRKILELHNAAVNTANWQYVSNRYDYSDVSDRLDLLAILYDKAGEIHRAIAILLESKLYCQFHGVEFDAQDLLDELEAARKPEPESGDGISRDSLDEAIRQVYATFGMPAEEIVVVDHRSRQFAATVNKRLVVRDRVSTQDVKRRLLVLRKRSFARGGLPKVKR